MSLYTPGDDEQTRRAIDRVAELRVSYDAGTLDEDSVLASPLDQFAAWFDQAVASGLPEPNAMVVATADGDGAPDGRIVLLKAADARGFSFYTNFGSAKGRQLAANPRASLVFPWFAMNRQVRVRGTVERVPEAEVAEYFASRPRESQLGAWVSKQSSVIDSRDGLEQRLAELTERFAGADVPVPDFWGGYLVRASAVEFWQGRPARLHDRLTFEAKGPASALDDPHGWELTRLSP